MVNITFEKEQTTQEIDFEGTIQNLLLYLDINPETVIVAQNDSIVQKDDQVDNQGDILIISVISGG